MTHPLLDVMTAAARGDFPAVDGAVTLLPELDGGGRAILAMTGHAYIAAGLDLEHFDGIRLDGFGAALSPAVVLLVADGRGEIGVHDVVLVAPGSGRGMQRAVTTMWDGHPRVLHARHLRTDVIVYGDRHGFVTVGAGLAGRREMSIEIDDTGASRGLGRQLITDALGGIAPSDVLFAAVAPGNARSLRSFLAAGFIPIGSEVIIDRLDHGDRADVGSRSRGAGAVTASVS